MKVNRYLCPWEVADIKGEMSREILGGILYEPENKTITITNGKALVQFIVEPEDGDRACIIPWDFYKDAAKSTPSSDSHVIIDTSEDGVISYYDKKKDRTISTKTMNGEYPEYNKIIEEENSPLVTVNLDVNLLNNISKAMGNSSVVLQVIDPHGKINIKYLHQDGDTFPCNDILGASVIMPLN